ncbi:MULTISPECIES: hypothetical protein [unclassified Rathayibacter]|uniref:hypothetical protein n=1 Tax=unclassified Rathayibacter TaxID=2609250 RepID=UPI0006F9AE11|nr:MULTISPECIES: hypothetical protein [unclassified Rathayibacter]KQQ05984.1 hypothetical protein ASF42_05450 [Rathayibacter sp. Leaf294]KQS13841.1 hypothetical protein ASG06_05460 [Rathayibacter sp. Leaf185]
MNTYDTAAYERPVAAIGMTQAQQQGELLVSRVLSTRGAGLYAYAYRLTLSDAAATAALRHAAVTLRSGSPRVLDEQTALEAARTEIGRRSVGRQEQAVAAGSAVLREDDLVPTGFHRRLHALPTRERQCWLLRHTGGHDPAVIADLLRITPEQVRAALASAATTLVEGELAEADGE